MLPLFALALAFGTALFPTLQPPFHPCVAASAVLLGLAALRARTAPLALASAGLCAGLALPAGLPEPPLLDGAVRLRGVVATAAYGTTADVDVTARDAGDGWAPLDGRVRVRFPETPPAPGAVVQIAGKARPVDLRRLPGETDPAWEAALARVASEVRAKEVAVLGARRPEPRLDGATHAGLLRAMLDGERSGLPAEEKALLQGTGTWHLVSISGLHIGILAGVAWGIAWVLTRPLALVWRRGGLKWPCAVAAVVAAFAYAGVAGWPLPARRAAWMTAAGALCVALHRKPGAWEVLALAWIASAWAEPAAVANPGCLLSFGALAGCLLVEPRVMRWVPPDLPRVVVWTIRGLATTLGATAGTLPVVAWRFQDLAPASPIANLWAVPLLGTVATPALLASQALPGELGRFALAVADSAADLALRGLAWLDVAPLHPAVGPVGAAGLVAALLLRKREIAAVGLGAIVLGARTVPRDLVVTFLAVGQGDGALVEWPDGRVWLVDGGPPGERLLAYLRRRGIRSLDLVVVSHPHPDHYGGLVPVLRELPVARVRVPRAARPGEDDYAALLAGHPLEIAATTPPWVLHPRPGWASPAREPVNDESLVVRLDHGRRRFLFPGDVEAAGEAALLDEDVRADVLKVPHHGSRTSSSAALVARVSPELAVVSCGAGNTYGHPHPRALASYRGVRLYRTDLDGNVAVRTDGDTLVVTTSEAPERWRVAERTW